MSGQSLHLIVLTQSRVCRVSAVYCAVNKMRKRIGFLGWPKPVCVIMILVDEGKCAFIRTVNSMERLSQPNSGFEQNRINEGQLGCPLVTYI